MTPDELSAYTCLSGGGRLVNPKYANDPVQAEQELKARCKVCWHLRQWFPHWIIGKDQYVDRWMKAKQSE